MPSTLSYDSARNTHNEIEIFNVNDDVIYNVPLPKCKRIATETPASVYTASTIGAVQSKQVLRVLVDSGATKTMIKKSVLPRGVEPRKLSTSKVMKTLAVTFAAADTVPLRDTYYLSLTKTEELKSKKLLSLIQPAAMISYSAHLTFLLNDSIVWQGCIYL